MPDLRRWRFGNARKAATAFAIRSFMSLPGSIGSALASFLFFMISRKLFGVTKILEGADILFERFMGSRPLKIEIDIPGVEFYRAIRILDAALILLEAKVEKATTEIQLRPPGV